MSNCTTKISMIEKIKYLYSHHMTLRFLFKKKLKKKRPTGILLDDIISILNAFPRNKWYPIIKNLVYEEDKNEHCCIINNDQYDNYPITDSNDILHFDLEDLKKEEFDIEPGIPYFDIKNNGIVFCYSYLPLDIRYSCDKNKLSSRIVNSGNIPSILGISYDGKLITDYYIPGASKDSYHYNYEVSYHNYKRKEDIPEPEDGEILYYIKQIVSTKLYDNDYEKYKKFINYCISHKFAYSKSYKNDIDKILK